MALTIDNRVCTGCKVAKSLPSFGKQGKYLRSKCKDCRKGESSYADQTPEQKRRYAETARVKLYGMTDEDYIEMLLKQDNRCGICRSPMLKPQIDHSHQTGKVRGFLCSTCNTGLGKLGDDIDGLKRAIKYLEES